MLAHIMWGLFPLYWRLLRNFDPLEVVAFRVVFAWSILFGLLPILLLRTSELEKQELRKNIRRPRVWLAYSLAACLIFTNWLVFLWAVGQNRILEASLGYYINPLLNVLLGVIIIRERLSPLQWLAVGVAASGVAIMTIAGGVFPWISLLLACTFSLYGLVKKQAQLPALLGLLLETSVLLLPAVLLALFCPVDDAAPAKDAYIWTLLLVGGLITIMPLGLFAYAAKRVPLSTLGILQYIGPTLQFIIGVVLLTQPFGFARFVGFVFVWIALLIYVLGSLKMNLWRAKEIPIEGADGG
jgi:chloramphenicol-sensitive protein RarD